MEKKPLRSNAPTSSMDLLYPEQSPSSSLTDKTYFAMSSHQNVSWCFLHHSLTYAEQAPVRWEGHRRVAVQKGCRLSSAPHRSGVKLQVEPC